jgi:cytochrome P450
METISLGGLILVVLAVAITYFLYFRVLRVYWDYNNMRKIISSEYNVLANPFSLLGPPAVRRQRADLEKYGDSQHFVKNEFRNYQLSMAVVSGKIAIDLCDPQLIREFY